MLVTIHDDTWNGLSVQHITLNSKKMEIFRYPQLWYLKWLKDTTTWWKGPQHPTTTSCSGWQPSQYQSFTILPSCEGNPALCGGFPSQKASNVESGFMSCYTFRLYTIVEKNLIISGDQLWKYWFSLQVGCKWDRKLVNFWPYIYIQKYRACKIRTGLRLVMLHLHEEFPLHGFGVICFSYTSILHLLRSFVPALVKNWYDGSWFEH